MMKQLILSVILISLCCVGIPPAVQGETIELSTALGEGSEPLFVLKESNKKLEATGLGVELIEAFNRKSPELRFTYKLQLIPFARIKEYLKRNTIQAVFCMARNAEREKEYQYADTPLYPVRLAIIARADDPDVRHITTFDDIARLGGTILGVRGTNVIGILQEKTAHLNIPIEVTTTIEQNFRKLLRGRGRYIAYNHYVLADGAKKFGYQDKVIFLPLVLKEIFHWLAFSKAVPHETVQKADAVLRELQESGELKRIYEKYGNLK